MIEKAPKEELQKIIDLGTDNRPGKEASDAWIKSLMGGVRFFLLKKPVRYRAYGPYWWLLKKMFVDSGDFVFGTDVDQDWVDALGYGSPEFNLAAAFFYESARFDSTNIFEPEHQLHDAETGEGILFISHDDEMEAM